MALQGSFATSLVPGARHTATEHPSTLRRNRAMAVPCHRIGGPSLLSRQLDTTSLACADGHQRSIISGEKGLRVASGAGAKGLRGGRGLGVHRSGGAPLVCRASRGASTAEPAAVTYKEQDTEDLLLSCTTFNVLAPIYKRVGGREDVRESMYPDQWRPRNERIVQELLARRSSIVCLQELWLSNPELVGLYEGELHAQGYTTLKLPRPNNRGDGLLTAIKEDRLEVVNHEDVLFNDCGDRCAQLVWIRSRPGTCRVPGAEADTEGAGEEGVAMGPCMEMLVVNTHLLFPHNVQSSVIRLRQVYKVLEHVEQYKARHNLGPVPVVLCGDLNGTKRGQVYNFLRSQGFVSSYDMAHNYPDSDQRWVTHRNHHGKVCGVDFIWLLNPREQTSPVALDWKAAVFNHLKAKLEERGCGTDQEAFQFFCNPPEEEEEEGVTSAGATSADVTLVGGEGMITARSMADAIKRIGSEMALSKGELAEIMAFADVDGNGLVSHDDLRTALQPRPCAPLFAAFATDAARDGQGGAAAAVAEVEGGEREAEVEGARGGLAVAEASLYPPETQAGVWPQDYTLSDHAVLTAVFSTIGMVMSRVEGC